MIKMIAFILLLVNISFFANASEETEKIEIGIFDFFGKKENFIQIYPFGVISVGEQPKEIVIVGSDIVLQSLNIPQCAPSQELFFFDERKFIAPFWLANSTSNTSYKTYNKTSGVSFADYLCDIKATFPNNSSFNEQDIDRVVVVKWEDFISQNTPLSLQKTSSFQVILVILSEQYDYKTFTLFRYEKLNLQFLEDIYRLYPPIQQCGYIATVGLGSSNTNNRISMRLQYSERYFRNHPPSLIRYFSNIPNYRNLGRYAFTISGLSKEADQPEPQQNCGNANCPNVLCEQYEKKCQKLSCTL